MRLQREVYAYSYRSEWMTSSYSLQSRFSRAASLTSSEMSSLTSEHEPKPQYYGRNSYRILPILYCPRCRNACVVALSCWIGRAWVSVATDARRRRSTWHLGPRCICPTMGAEPPSWPSATAAQHRFTNERGCRCSSGWLEAGAQSRPTISTAASCTEAEHRQGGR